MNTLWLPLLLSSVILAEEQYFPQLPNVTWAEARHYCQACFMELTTITCSNVRLIVKNLSLSYWVGLRRSYNGSIPWSEWSNGEPVTFQNWYPGHPVPKKEKEMISICPSTTESPLSTIITTTTDTQMTSLETSTVTSAPGTSAPGTSAPGTSAPGTSTPGTSTPGTSTPVTSTPVTSTPVTSAPVTSTPITSAPETSAPETSAPITSPKISTMFQTEEDNDTCPILIDMLECLNKTCDVLESILTGCERTTTVTPKTTTYSTIAEITTFSTTFNATTTKGATTAGSTTEGGTTAGSTTESETTEGSTTEDGTTEGSTTERTTTSNCIFKPKPDPEQYIEDACVVLLRFGMWKEIHCNESLPYICYDERFFGQIYYSDVSTSSVNVSWSEGPGAENISHYRVEITEVNNWTYDHTYNETYNDTFNQTDLFQTISNLTAGTLYRVQVFPVKCGRDLNPQNISFYTQPSDVQNLTIVSMTKVSANLMWRKPEGKRDFYSVHVECKSNESILHLDEKCLGEVCTINNLVPGYEYEFTVKAVVNATFGGVPSSASDYTKPSIVKNLKPTVKKESTFIIASWEPPVGGHSGYHYCLEEVDNSHECKDCSSMTSSSFTTNDKFTNADITTSSSSTTNLIMTTRSSSTTNNKITVCNNTIDNNISEVVNSSGSKFCLCVQALTKNDTIAGEMTVISAYTYPKTPVNLTLNPDSQRMEASWTLEQGKYEIFEVNINTTAYKYTKEYNTTDFHYTFTELKAGVYYTVSVVTRNGGLTSVAAIMEGHTKPAKPTSLNAIAHKTSVDLSWKAPDLSTGAKINYMVKCHNSFRKELNETITTETKLTFDQLSPGTNYTFTVLVVVGDSKSDAETDYAMTEPQKRTLVLTMLCSSEKPLYCDEPETKRELFTKLKSDFTEKFKDMVYWNLSWKTIRNN
ncbi:receptor-type tyrosine-protein phosphatase eta-like isoform X2 [Carassius gibelio]|uniref:receptor-type tyrosine-protein phosphatase eta-like isoform X2 n=1 Tax=Carassius gibelio TaxID=101364 RepID=UPI002278A7CC|nr:receptor-type tyrosine-protein phosphatase eta-like isoform X2 [Carassius gibelio]